MSTTIRTYNITRDGETVGKTLTLTDAYHFLHCRVPYSVDHAIKYEGWSIITPEEVSQ